MKKYGDFKNWMMKKGIILALFIWPVVLFSQNNFIVDAKISSKSDIEKAYLTYRVGHVSITDSALVNSRSFRFAGSIPNPVEAKITLTRKGESSWNIASGDVLPFYIESGRINLTINDSVKNASISGSVINSEAKKYNALIIPIEKAIAEAEKNMAASDDKEKMISSFKEEKHKIQVQYIKENPNSYLSYFILTELAAINPFDYRTIEPLYKNLSGSIRNTPAGLEFAEILEKEAPIAIGAVAPDFTQKNITGKPVSLKDFRGKYVLLDFWGSWCKPCRQENPYLVKAYNKYKDKNFTIVSVSLDQNKDSWAKAVDEDKLEWTQLSDLKYWNNDAARLYQVRSIPRNFLIGPGGVIIAKGLRGEALSKKLEEVLIK